MTIVLIWVLGAVAGSVLWSAFLRLPGYLARWLCAPFDHPGRVAMVTSLLVSLVFLAMAVVGALLGLALIIDRNAVGEDAKKVLGILWISSWLGYFTIPVIVRLEHQITARRKP